MNTELETQCARALRELRRKKGYTLSDCELKSNGKIKAVVLGSYERQARAISLAKLVQLAEFYEVPVDYFLNPKEGESDLESGRLIFDIRKIRNRTFLDETLVPLKRFLNAIADKRSDWNAELISLRSSDSDTLALLTELNYHELKERLVLENLLFKREI